MSHDLSSAPPSRLSATASSRFRLPGIGIGRVRAGAIALGTALVIALTPGGAGTLAGPTTHPPYLTASGHFSVVALIDNPTYAGEVGYWHSGTHPSLYKLFVRRPIVFASSRVSGNTSQTVGWRYQIEYSTDEANWSVIASSPVFKSTATRGQEASWQDRVHDFASRPANGYYRVKVRVFWYWPNSTTLDGNGTLYPQFCGVREPFEQFLYNDCPQPLV
jgi:hypothetical protein